MRQCFFISSCANLNKTSTGNNICILSSTPLHRGSFSGRGKRKKKKHEKRKIGYPARFRFHSPQAPRAYFSPLPISQAVRKKEASGEEGETKRDNDDISFVWEYPRDITTVGRTRQMQSPILTTWIRHVVHG